MRDGLGESTDRLVALLEQPVGDRRSGARRCAQRAGRGAFGEFDGYTLWEAPDNVSMAAVAIAIGGSGSLSKFETTVLMSVEDAMDAMGRAAQIEYRPPGA